MEPSPAQRAARDRIAAGLARAGYALPGTLTVRAYACGKPGCRCHADPPRPAPPPRPLRRMDPQDRRQDRHPPAHPRRAGRVPAAVRQREETPRTARRTPGPHPRDHRGRQPPAAKPRTGRI